MNLHLVRAGIRRSQPSRSMAMLAMRALGAEAVRIGGCGDSVIAHGQHGRSVVVRNTMIQGVSEGNDRKEKNSKRRPAVFRRIVSAVMTGRAKRFARIHGFHRMMRISTAKNTMTEGGSASGFHFTRSSSSGTLTVGYSLSGSAMQAMDYGESGAGLVSFGDGESTKDITVTPYDDASVEGTETIGLTINSNFSYTIGTGSATMNLYDNDTVQVTVAKQGGDPTEGGNGTFRITRTGGTTGDLIVSYTVGGTATSGTDYSSIGTSATIPDGSSSVDVMVPTLADNLVDSGETVIMTITDGGSTYTANNANASMTITDDPPVISLTVGNTTEGSATPGYVRFTRSGGKTADSLPLSYSIGGTAENGTDYEAISASATIAAGQTSVDVNISAYQDNVVEDYNETVTLTIVPTSDYVLVGGAISDTGVVTISDDSVTVDDDNQTTHDSAVAGFVNAWDSEGHTVSLVVTTAPTKGSVELSSDGNYTYTPDAGATGTDTFGTCLACR